MWRLLAGVLLFALPIGMLAACMPDDTKAKQASPGTGAGAFADAVAAALRQRLRDIEPLPEPAAESLAIVFSRTSVILDGGGITVTRGRRGNWHIVLHGDAAEHDEATFLAGLERTAIFLPELIRQRRIFRSVATLVAPGSFLPSTRYTLQIDPIPESGAILHLKSERLADGRTWTHASYADSLRRIEAFVRHEDDGAKGS